MNAPGEAKGSQTEEVIDSRTDTALGEFSGYDAMRKLVEQFCQKATTDLADRVSAKLPAPRSGP